MIVIYVAGYSPTKIDLSINARLNLQGGHFGAWYRDRKILRLLPVDFLSVFSVYCLVLSAMTPTVQFRVADFSIREDISAFVELLDLYSRDPFGSGKPMPHEILDVLPDRWREHPGAFTVLAWLDQIPVGLANCLTSFSTFRAKTRINIHDLVVHPEHRGKGLGRQLIEAVCAEGVKRGACQVTLEVRADNEYARQLYQRCGFRGVENPIQPGTHFFGVRGLDPAS